MWRVLIVLSLLVGGNDQPLNEARRLMVAGQYESAINQYRAAQQEYPTRSAEISYNIGLAYLQLDQPELAKESFFQALTPVAPEVASLASNQLGILMVAEGRPREALSSFREALLYDPAHEQARYNYELLALRLGQNPNSPPPPPSPGDPPPPSQENLPPSLDPYMQSLLQKLEQRQRQTVPAGDQAREIGGDTLTLGEAYQMLELMYKQERQYIQQLRKISSPSAEREGRPKW